MKVNARYFRRKEMAKHLGISERFLSDLVSRRIVPVISIGHRTKLFDPAKVEKALERFEQREVGRERDYE